MSVIYLSAALGAIFNANHYRRISDDIFGNAGLSYVTGFLAVIIGFLIVHYHNYRANNRTVLIAIVGWLALIKGIIMIIFPQYVHRLSGLIFTGLGLRMFPYVGILMGLLFGAMKEGFE
jgi:uncharacterized membrane protein HdeD (DUF308 family)